MAWMFRSAFNCAVLHAMTKSSLPDTSRAIKKNAGDALTMGLTTMAGVGMLPATIGPRALYLDWLFATEAIAIWFCVMSAEDVGTHTQQWNLL